MSRWCQDAAVSAAPRRLSVYSAVCGAGRAGVVTASAGHPGCSPRPDLRDTERRHRPHPQHWHALTTAHVICIPFLLSLRSVSALGHDGLVLEVKVDTFMLNVDISSEMFPFRL